MQEKIKMKHKYSDLELQIKSVNYRKSILKYIKMANAGHTGGSLSCTDILNVLYNDILNVFPENFGDKNRDRFVQSKGHSVESLYVVLADQGFFPENNLETISKFQSKYVGHPTRKVHGIEFNTGALGHGLPLSAGIALAGKKDHLTYKVFTLLGDGELAEGSNWEAAMMAAHYKLDNLVAILDHNSLQISGRIQDVCSPYPIDEKFRAFGWSVISIDGNSIPQLREALSKIPVESDKPTLVIANTIKGKGVSYMEDNAKWHHGVPMENLYNQAIDELDQQLAELTKKMI